MLRGKLPIQAPKRKRVWRISEAAPQGEFVDTTSPPPAPPAADAAPSSSQEGWARSSFDLLTGVEVTEEDSSTVPAELFDELFNRKK